MIRLRLMAAALPALAAVALVAGCGGGTTAASPASCEPATGLIIAVSVHRNVSAPDLPSALRCRLERTIDSGEPVSVIGIDGTPEILLSNVVFPITDANDIAHQEDVASAVNTVLRTVRDAQADSDGSDVLGAISIAADAARTAGKPGSIVEVIDSGISDVGPLDFTATGMTGADPSEVADYLAHLGQLPNLSGLVIDLVGFGYVALPQSPLNQAQVDNVRQVWISLLHRAGATVTDTPAPRTGPSPDTGFTAKTVQPGSVSPPLLQTTSSVSRTSAETRQTAPPTPPPCDAVFGQASPLGFTADSTDFIEPSQARAAVQAFGEWLGSDPGRTATIVGTTANDGDLEGQQDLALRRAQQVGTLLVDGGASSTQLTATGVGSNFPGYLLDRLPDGTLDPGPAAANRTVRVTLSGPGIDCP